MNWKIIDEQAPEATRSGHIEAVDRTLFFGFTDDIAIRVTGSAKAAKVDIRSSSRFGQHDLGRNAERIRRFMSEVKHRLAELERLDRMERVIASKAADKDKSKTAAKVYPEVAQFATRSPYEGDAATASGRRLLHRRLRSPSSQR